MKNIIQNQRIQLLNDRLAQKGKFVIYWMQAAQRTKYNHALEYSILSANDLNQPLIVYFGLTAGFPEANARHYHFMLEGLREVKEALKARRILMCIRYESPQEGIVELANKASLVVVDRGYLRTQREWRYYAAQKLICPLIQVETEAIVPVETASIKEEYSAATIRPKITKLLSFFLQPLAEHELAVKSIDMEVDSLNLTDIGRVMAGMPIDKSIMPVKTFKGGHSQAVKLLDDFIHNKLENYPEARNDPNADALSNMSPYLHFGQISPLYISLKVLDSGSRGSEAYLDELIIRRELSFNFVYYNRSYANFAGLPEWAKRTLLEHARDTRPYLYLLNELENAATHDQYWNAAQNEMKLTGKMNGYMRMYWGKKIIEWTTHPEEAFNIALNLNNKYELDGRDPNGFTGVSWCFGKHDRPWVERAVFGNIRYMNDKGLCRKFDADKYAAKFAAA